MATTFKFRYQTILDAREKEQQVLEIEMGRLTLAIRDQEQAIARWRTVRRRTIGQMRRARERGDLRENARCSDYLRHVRRSVARCRAGLAQLEERQDGLRGELVQVMQSRKVLENYRDRLKVEFAMAQEKAEEQTTDTHSVSKFLRAGDAA